MSLVAATVQEMLEAAVTAARLEEGPRQEALNRIAAPVYVTDAQGWLTAHNRACVPFAGRTPKVGGDRWCVTWKLYTPLGDVLPHEDCPMAVAVRGACAVRGAEAVAERPGGSRVHFVPYPTPVTDEDGRLVGAVNVLLDISNQRQAPYYRSQAERCRRLARTITDPAACASLLALASQYELRADRPLP